MSTYALLLGKIVSNLQSLEFSLRAFLTNNEVAKGKSFNIDLAKLKVGDQVSVNAFTNYDSLRQCIRKYNGIVARTDPSLCVDETVVDLRDAIAHGRASAPSPTDQLGLLKFDKPNAGSVTVVFAQQMSAAWLSRQCDSVATLVKRVEQASARFGWS